MATEPGAAQQIPTRPSVFVAREGGAAVAGADAAICTLASATADDLHDGGIIWLWAPGDTLPAAARVCVAATGLVAAAELARIAPAVFVVPRVEVRRASRNYGFSRDNSGSGFNTFQLDPATVAAFTVLDAGTDTPLADWLRRAGELGFSEVWLQCSDSAGVSTGLLVQAHRAAPELGFWVTGDSRWLRRVETAQVPPGLAALVVAPADLAGFPPEVVAPV